MKDTTTLDMTIGAITALLLTSMIQLTFLLMQSPGNAGEPPPTARPGLKEDNQTNQSTF